MIRSMIHHGIVPSDDKVLKFKVTEPALDEPVEELVPAAGEKSADSEA